MKRLAKQCLFTLAPRGATALFAARARAHSHRVLEEWGCPRVNDALFARLGDRVRRGPFEGLVLVPETKAEQIGPCLLGLYESELEPAWEVVLRGRYRQVIDIGAKVGYYAVGLARRFPEASVVAFDADPWSRRVLGKMARANGVGNLRIRGCGTPRRLARHLVEGSLVLSDCEGFEGDLFCTEEIPHLASAVLVIETHDALVPGTSTRLRERLGPTHRLVEIATDDAPRTPPEGLDLGFLDERARTLALHEVRPPQTWLLGLPRSGPNRALAEADA